MTGVQTCALPIYFDYYVPDAKKVVLPQHNTEFAFRFTAMNYQLQHRIHYQYMLEGHDTNWRNADKDRMAHYSGVPTGTYRFKVKAFLLESPDKFDMRVIEVVVPPYFLLSSQAVWLYMLIIAALSIGIMYFRQEQIRKKHPQAEPAKKASALSRGPIWKKKTAVEEKTDNYELIVE